MDRSTSIAKQTEATRAGGASDRAVAIRLFLTCWLIYAAHFATNTVREIYPALSLGDHLSFDVSEYVGLHPDIFTLPGRGAFINNNPGASIVGAVPYALSRPLIDRAIAEVQRRRRGAPDQGISEYASTYPMARAFYREARARGYDIKFGLGAAVMQALGMAPLSALSVVVMFWTLRALALPLWTAVAFAVLYGVATPVLYRTAQLNHNLIVAHCAFFAFMLLWQPWSHAPVRTRAFFVAGVLAGWAVVCDYSGAIVVVAIGWYALRLWRGGPAPRQHLALPLSFATGVACTVAVLLAYQWYYFGNPLLPAQSYMPAATYTHLGYAGMDRPHLDLLWETAFSARYGLFTSAPLLILALYPPAWLRLRLLGTRETEAIALFCGLFFLFCSANQYGRMQFNCGVRHVVPVTAFLFLITAGVLHRLRTPIVVAVAFAATYWAWCLAMYRDVEQGRGIIESVIHITTEGVRLPWLTVIQQMGYARGVSAALVLLGVGAAIAAIWAVRPRRILRAPGLSVPTAR